MSTADFLKNPSELASVLEKKTGSFSAKLLLGGFEILDAAHAIILQTAKHHCDLLIVALLPDQYFQAKYGHSHPFCSLAERTEMLLSTKYVDYVVEFSPDLIEQVQTTQAFKIISYNQSSELASFFQNIDSSLLCPPEVSYDEPMATQYAISKILETSGLKASSASTVDVYAGYSPYLTENKLLSIIPEQQLPSFIEPWRAQQKFLITTNGSFDLLHLGHIRYLTQAKKIGGTFLVLVNDDPSIQNSKGPLRPIFNQQERMQTLASLSCIDHVIPFSGDNPLYLLEQIKPNIHVKGGSFEESRIAQEKQLVESHGGTFQFFELTEGLSSTNLLEKIVTFYKHTEAP
ncbi:MAG: adenylyltransferase/cytidyltransferase family protein [SAR324 cluster bacterium]|nr:adenylyltransferase/cytidyltransferase family protein [SAR324 cluster bacterium]